MESEHDRLTNIIHVKAQSHPKRKFLVAIAGAPGSGKTTLAKEVVRRLNDGYRQGSTSSASETPSACSDESQEPVFVNDKTHPHAVLVSMDGFHLPRATLDSLPNREQAYARRGAPWTFDLSQFLGFMKSLRASADPSPTRTSEDEREDNEDNIYAPTFSHELKDPIAHGQHIRHSSEIIIVEGNYLLLDEPGWRDIADMVDLCVYVDADPVVTRDRVAQRHVSAGIEKTLEAAYARVDGNDALNGSLVREKRLQADMTVTSVNDDRC